MSDESMSAEDLAERAEVVRRLLAEVQAGRLTATQFDRGYLAGSLATLEALAGGEDQPTP